MSEEKLREWQVWERAWIFGGDAKWPGHEGTADPRDTVEEFEKLLERLQARLPDRETRYAPYPEEVRQAIFALEDKYDIELTSMEHHCDIYDWAEKLEERNRELKAKLRRIKKRNYRG
jgi:hypothetical protein